MLLCLSLISTFSGSSSVQNHRSVLPINKHPLTALRSVTARGEGTDVDANKNDKLYAIGNNRNTESHIFQVRDELADQPDVATIQWEALSRGEFSLFVPSYSALLTELDPELYPTEAEFDVSHVGELFEYTKDESGNKIYVPEKIAANEATALEDSGKKYLDYVFMDLNTLAYNHRDTVAEGVHDYLMVLQQEIMDQHAQVDELMLGTAAEDRVALANKAHDVVSEEVYAKSNALLNEVRAYIKAGDFSEPFVASDLADGALATPLNYYVRVADAKMFRLYNPYTGEHFYTASAAERDFNVGLGWQDEGVGWVAPVDGTPVFRVYNPYAGDHHYTTSEVERDHLVSVGWNDEGIGWYSAGEDGLPLFRQYNPNAIAGAHNYTTSEVERDYLVSAGWNDEGIGWYGLA